MRRREFLQVIGAAGAAATVGGCARGGGPKDLIPYLIPADDGVQPGMNVEYATVCRECPAGCGMIAQTRDGRVHKVEGNPDHPINRGKLCLRGQASLQGLYNPDRIRQPLARDATGRLVPVSWEIAERRLGEGLRPAHAGRIAWMGRLETGAFDRLVDRWLSIVSPSHLRLRYEAFAYEPLRTAAGRVFGRRAIPQFRIDRAHHLVSFGADFVETWISNVEYTRQYSAWRQARIRGEHQGRYVFIAPRLSLTGQNADEWVAIRPGAEGQVAHALLLAAQAARSRTKVPVDQIVPLAAAAGVKPETLERIGRGLAAGGPALALPMGNAGHTSGAAEAQEAILRLNAAVGAVGSTLLPGWPHALSEAAAHHEVLQLIAAIQSGEVSALVLHHVNPVYDLPPSLGFGEAVKKVPLVVSFASQPDDTTGAPGENGGVATLVLPDYTPLESWGEYSPRPGITGILQPVVPPVFAETRATGDVLLTSAARLGHDIGSRTFQDYLRRAYPMDDAEWMGVLQRGGVFTTAKEPPRAGSSELSSIESRAILTETDEGAGQGTAVQATIGFATSVFDNPPPGTPARSAGRAAGTGTAAAAPPVGVAALQEDQLWLHVYPSMQLFDGSLANRPWAQEIPDPVIKAVWGSWAEIHPATADRLGVHKNETLLVLETPHGHLEVPAILSQGVHQEVIAIQIGQGHSHAGHYAWAAGGVNPMVLLPGTADLTAGALAVSGLPVSVKAAAARRPVVVLQESQKQHSTGEARALFLKDLTRAPEVINEKSRESLYSTIPPMQHPRTHRKWGMVIDLDRCVGCNACVAACYAENNVPIVGKTECQNGREMSWIRIETYTGQASSADATRNPDPAVTELDVRFLPMVCMQCDNAPCEYVCPVNATVHNDEGLNMQVYNRCVGTRFCSNNCPYKVRRFNWFTFPFPYPLDQQLNPDIIHRTKGVMEKCSFCIQRIRRHEIDSEAERRPIRDGEIQTACMQSCPADAIIFGDQDDARSVVHRHFHREKRGYGVLEDLNTYPNVQYLERVRMEEV